MTEPRGVRHAHNSVWLPEGFSFLSGYPTHVRKQRVLVPYQVMLDDSGGKGQGPYLVLGGLIGQAEAFADLADQWAAWRDASPSIRYFKMSEAAARSKEFLGFSDEQRDAKLRGFAAILNSPRLAAIHVTLDTGAHAALYDKVAPRPRKKREQKRVKGAPREVAVLANPYAFAFATFMYAASHHLWDTGVREPFDFIVDEFPSVGKRLEPWYRFLRELVGAPERDLLPQRPLPRDDVDFLPLQAADFIAWSQRALNTDPSVALGWLWKDMPDLRRVSLCPALDAEFFAGLDAGHADALERPYPPEQDAALRRVLREIAERRGGRRPNQ